MTDSLERLVRDAGFALEGGRVRVDLPGARKHIVRLREGDGAIELRAVVAKPGRLGDPRSATLLAWEKNRAVHVVGFHMDDKGRLIGRARVPKAGLDPAELAFVIRRLAAESDRLEYLLTGADVE